jgi:diacylglycerol O-acyltransferase / wax synthase
MASELRVPQTNEEAWELAAAWGTRDEMSPFEGLMWRIERDPRLRSTVGCVYLLDRVPDWDRLVAAFDWGTRLIPRARQRVLDPPLQLGLPQWVDDERFDLRYHLRRMALPAPGTFRQLLDLAEQLMMTPFDRARPPWETVLVEGMEDGRAGYVFKGHHTLTDGQGGVQLMGLLHSRKREHSPNKPVPEPPAPQPASTATVLAGQLARRTASAPAEGARVVGGALSRVLRPRTTAGGALRFARSLERVLTPPPCEPSPLLRGRSLSWRFGTLEVALDELKRAGKAGGGSLNDAFLAALLGGFRHYHEHHGVDLDELPIAIPISLRRGDHPMGGNRFAGARFAAPAGERDPAERIRLIREFVLTARAEPAIDALELLAPLLNTVPVPVLTRFYVSQSEGIDLQASNVAGLPWQAYIAGARIDRTFPFGPLPGCAVMATLMSHVGVCCIGFNMDTAAVTDTDLFMQCQQQGLDEVLALGRPARPRSRRRAPATTASGKA